MDDPVKSEERKEREQKHQQCEQWKGNILSMDNTMKFMSYHMHKLGCGLGKEHYICKPCDQPTGGHFAIDEGVGYEILLSVAY
jgi:inner membrane protease ATP23